MPIAKMIEYETALDVVSKTLQAETGSEEPNQQAETSSDLVDILKELREEAIIRQNILDEITEAADNFKNSHAVDYPLVNVIPAMIRELAFILEYSLYEKGSDTVYRNAVRLAGKLLTIAESHAV